MKSTFSLFDMDAIIRKSGADRVGEDASMKLDEFLTDCGRDIVFLAKRLSLHAGRKSITREDIMLAAAQFRS
jgi:histone H3/H4